jgi:hypothetical protein
VDANLFQRATYPATQNKQRGFNETRYATAPIIGTLLVRHEPPHGSIRLNAGSLKSPESKSSEGFMALPAQHPKDAVHRPPVLLAPSYGARCAAATAVDSAACSLRFRVDHRPPRMEDLSGDWRRLDERINVTEEIEVGAGSELPPIDERSGMASSPAPWWRPLAMVLPLPEPVTLPPARRIAEADVDRRSDQPHH